MDLKTPRGSALPPEPSPPLPPRECLPFFSHVIILVQSLKEAAFRPAAFPKIVINEWHPYSWESVLTQEPTSAGTFAMQASGERVIFTSVAPAPWVLNKETQHTECSPNSDVYSSQPAHSEVEKWLCICAWCSGLLYSEHRSCLIVIRRVFLHIFYSLSNAYLFAIEEQLSLDPT